MKQPYLFLLPLIIACSVQSQTQKSIGGAHTTSEFNSIKYDGRDTSTINAGYIYDSIKASGRDWFLVKLDKNKNIVWQKIFTNAGDDFIYKVIVCKNGDYVAVGVLMQNGIPRGFICRMNSSNGDIIWSSVTNNSSAGEICYDVVETKNGNIAVAATDQWTGSPNCFIIVLKASGKKLWSEVSTYSAADQPYSIGQLANGNLLVGINEWVGGHYNLILAELNVKDGSLITQNTYSINATIPNSGLSVNSLAAWGINLIDRQVSLYCYAFQGSGGTSSMCIYKYNTSTKKLSGNICYHVNDVNTAAFNYTPIGRDDFLISQSFTNPTSVYVARITNGYVVYDDLIKDAVTSIKSIDTTISGAVFSGSILVKQHNNTYNLFEPRTDPVINTSCHISSSRTLNLIPSQISATTTNDISFVSGGILLTGPIAFTNSVYKPTAICGDAQTMSLSFSTVNANITKQTIFTASPNPVIATVHFNIPFSNKQSSLNIYNINGKKVLTQQLSADVTSKNINLRMLTPGMYNVVLIRDKETFSLRLIKN